MIIENTGTVGTEGTADTSVATDTTIATDVSETPDVAPGTEPVTAQPAYTPSFGFKYAKEGKQAEAEFDDIFKPLVKDADTEKKIRELHEKAYGLDFIKSDRDTVKQWASQIAQEHEQQSKALQTMGAYLKHGDFDSAFEILGLTEEQIIKYALNKVQYKQMSPEQRAAYDNQLSSTRRMMALEAENQELSQSYQSFAVQQREGEVEMVLSRPDVSSVVQAFDQRVGRPGAFRDEVIKRGKLYAHQGYDAPAQQVIGELINLVGGVPTPQQTIQQGMGQQPRQAKPTLPNITGKGTSPVKKIPKSIDDLRKLAATMSAAEM